MLKRNLIMNSLSRPGQLCDCVCVSVTVRARARCLGHAAMAHGLVIKIRYQETRLLRPLKVLPFCRPAHAHFFNGVRSLCKMSVSALFVREMCITLSPCHPTVRVASSRPLVVYLALSLVLYLSLSIAASLPLSLSVSLAGIIRCAFSIISSMYAFLRNCARAHFPDVDCQSSVCYLVRASV